MNNFQSGRVSVWWDLDNCGIPQNVDAFDVAKNLSTMLENARLMGPATIDAFGDTKRLGQKLLEGLSSTGINLNHISGGKKETADKAILVAMLFWALDNAPPASLVLISGDGDFANALNRLRLKGYNVVLVQPDQPIKSALLGAASSVWYWESVANGHTHIDGFSEAAPQKRWVLINDMNYEFAKDIWMDLGHFLCCEKNRELIMKSNTRLEAARILKCSGPARIQHLLIGQVILLLNQSIQRKKWLCTCGEGWSFVINLQAVMMFVEPVTQEEGTEAADLMQNALTNVAKSPKVAPKRRRGRRRGRVSSSTGEELHIYMILQQSLKKWLLQLPYSSQGYDLSYIQRGLTKDADIFLDQMQLVDMIGRFSDDFLLERQNNGLLLIFQKRQVSNPLAKQHVQTELASSVVCKQQEYVADAAPQTLECVAGKLGSHKSGQSNSTREPPRKECNSLELIVGLLCVGALAGIYIFWR